MQVNALPRYDNSVNTTGCCPKFNPQGWDGADLHFRGKTFVRARTNSIMHVPLNMGPVFARVQAAMEKAGAADPANTLVLSRDLSPWKAEHLFASDRDVSGEEMTTLTGDFVTKVFEGPYRKAGEWHDEMQQAARAKSGETRPVWFFYTTCPKCAKAYGENYVVGVAQV